MESVLCDYCGCGELDEVVRQTDILHKTTTEFFSITKCSNCGLQFLNPRPTKEEIGQYYATEYSFHATPPKIRRVAASLLSWAANSPFYYFCSLVPGLNQKLSAYVVPSIKDPVRKYFTGGRVLDIGCGAGISAHFWGREGGLLAYKRFAEVYGVEVAGKARAALSAHGIEAFKSLADVPDNLYFEIIRMNWSLEHVHAPSEYFDFISDRLAEGGKAIIAIPNYDGLIYRLAKDCVEVPIHLYHFRQQDIANYAEKFGLKIVESQTFSYPQMFLFAAEILPRLSKSFTSPMNIIEARVFQKLLSRLDSLGMGNDMIMVLEKK